MTSLSHLFSFVLVIAPASSTAFPCEFAGARAARYLRDWSGPVKRDIGFKSALVFCCGTIDPSKGYRGEYHHIGRVALADQPDRDWYDISAHLRCTKCGFAGYVDTGGRQSDDGGRASRHRHAGKDRNTPSAGSRPTKTGLSASREGRHEIHGNAMTAVGTKLTPTSYLKASGNV